MVLASIPSPPANSFPLGPLHIRFYGLMYVVGITCAVIIGRRRWKAQGGDPAFIDEMALWGVPAGIIGGRIYFDITTPSQVQPHWWGPLAVWKGGLGIWGGVALATVVCVWRARKMGVNVPKLMDAVAPALLVAQAIGRIGNYFNQELFGGPTSLPWGLQISPALRPSGYADSPTFHPTFLYELIWDLAFAAFLVWLGHHRRIRPGGLFALYVAGYSAFRIFEESLRVDYSLHFLGLRLNMYIAAALMIAALGVFVYMQRLPVAPAPADGVDPTPGEVAGDSDGTALSDAGTDASTDADADGDADASAEDTEAPAAGATGDGSADGAASGEGSPEAPDEDGAPDKKPGDETVDAELAERSTEESPAADSDKASPTGEVSGKEPSNTAPDEEDSSNGAEPAGKAADAAGEENLDGEPASKS